MIKRIIFDIDGTLLDTQKDCLEAYDFYLRDNFKEVTALDLYNVIEEYDKQNRDYSIEDISRYINKNLIKGFTSNNFKDILNVYSSCATLINPNTKIILKNLAKNYELVVLSSWYVASQKERLNKAGILEYFKEVYGFENSYKKPDKRAFDIACGDNKYEECLMVGDSITSDIEVPDLLGMKTLLLSKENSTKYNAISSLDDIIKKIDK